jgi:hypothetical protein
MAFRSSSVTLFTAPNTVTATQPAGTIAGDVVIGLFSADNSLGQNIAFPPGWTQVRSDAITNGDNQVISWGWIVSTGSESYAFTNSTGGSDNAVLLASYSGDSGTPIDITPSFNNPDLVTPPGSPVVCTGLSITPVDNGCDIVMLAGVDTNSGAASTFSASGSLNLRASTGTDLATGAIADFNQATAGATGNQTITWTSAGSVGNFVAYLIALKPLASGFNGIATRLNSNGTFQALGFIEITGTKANINGAGIFSANSFIELSSLPGSVIARIDSSNNLTALQFVESVSIG